MSMNLEYCIVDICRHFVTFKNLCGDDEFVFILECTKFFIDSVIGIIVERRMPHHKILTQQSTAVFCVSPCTMYNNKL